MTGLIWTFRFFSVAFHTGRQTRTLCEFFSSLFKFQQISMHCGLLTTTAQGPYSKPGYVNGRTFRRHFSSSWLNLTQIGLLVFVAELTGGPVCDVGTFFKILTLHSKMHFFAMNKDTIHQQERKWRPLQDLIYPYDLCNSVSMLSRRPTPDVVVRLSTVDTISRRQM